MQPSHSLHLLALFLLMVPEGILSARLFRRSVSQSNKKYQCGIKREKAQDLITSGSSAKIGEWPWHGALFHRNTKSREYKCGATLILQSFVITAAHCVVNHDTGYELSARLISIDFGYVTLWSSSTHRQSHVVQEIFVHPDFFKNKHDIALLSLQTVVRFSDYVLPVCLEEAKAATNIHNIVGRNGVVVGWGLTEDDKTSTDLKQANLPVVDYADCQESKPDLFAQLIYPGMFCAGYRNGTSVCNGDSGGGMFFHNGTNWILRGITSFSGARDDHSNRCNVHHYVGFMNVQFYQTWMRLIINGEGDETSDQLEQVEESPVTEVCLRCICNASSGCSPTVRCTGNVCGMFQITPPYWSDAGKPVFWGDTPESEGGTHVTERYSLAYENCANDFHCAARTVQGYMRKFRQDCNGDGIIDCLDYAAIHTLGRYGCKNPVPVAYQNKVDQCIRHAARKQFSY